MCFCSHHFWWSSYISPKRKSKHFYYWSRWFFSLSVHFLPKYAWIDGEEGFNTSGHSLKPWAGTWCVSCMWFPVSTECNHVLISIFEETSRNSLPSCDWVGNRLATAARLSYACNFLGYVTSIVLLFLLCPRLLSYYFLVLSCLFFFFDRTLLSCPTHHLWCSTSLGVERYRMGGWDRNPPICKWCLIWFKSVDYNRI